MALEDLCPGMLLWYLSSNLHEKVCSEKNQILLLKKGFTNEIY